MAKRPCRGFTLVELIVIIVIVGIVALIAAPRFFAQADYDARRFHDMALSAIRYAQKVAIAQRRSVFVVATPSAVSLCYDAGCASAVPSPGDGSAYSVAAPTGIVITAAGFSFNGLGQPSPNAQVVLSVTGDGMTRQIIVEAETGYVHP
jgi:MSHA pilin protein MshC